MTSNPILSTPAGSELHGVVITEEDHNLEQWILDFAQESSASERVGETAAAMSWARSMLDAMKARRPEVVRALEAEEAKRLEAIAL